MTKKIVKKGNFSGPGSTLIEEIIKEQNIDMTLFYVHSFKVKKGTWDTAAKKREQELEWTIDETDDSKQQLMSGYSKHFPEFMVNENKNNSIEVHFMRLPIEFDILDSFKRIIKEIPTSPYTRRKPIFSPGSGHAFELSTFDAHMGKLAAEVETGYRNYDTKIAAADYLYVSRDLLNQAIPYKPEKIFIPLGQDLYHVDNVDNHTTHGSHAMDVDGRITKVNDIIFDVVLDTILRARQLAPVKVIWSPGNHDHFASYMLCFALVQYFRNDPLVEIDISLPPRGKKINKAEVWGTLLVGFTHRIVGKHNTWANELAQSFPELWAHSKFREWHHGDQHYKQDVKTTPTFTSGGVLCRQLTALSPVDRWHTENMFTDAVPGGEGFIWHKTKGVRANFMAWTGQYEENRNVLVNQSK